MTKVLIAHFHDFELWRAPVWLAERLRDRFPNVEFVQLAKYDEVAQEVADSDVFIGWLLRPPEFLLANRLRWVHSPAAAVHQLMFPELVKSNVVVTNATDIHGPVVAEHAIALVLALAKRLPQAMEYQRRKTWAQQLLWNELPRPREVADSTVLLVGMGGIGHEFALRAKALGMKVLAVRENPAKGKGAADAVYGPKQLEELLPQADYVVLCTPVTPATTGLINQDRLAGMKRDSYLINVGRGPLVDEEALLAALRSGTIAGAALDVFLTEPLPESSPLWSVPNLLITPHTAAVTERLWERHFRHISENLGRFLSAQPLLNQVDKRQGY